MFGRLLGLSSAKPTKRARVEEEPQKEDPYKDYELISDLDENNVSWLEEQYGRHAMAVVDVYTEAIASQVRGCSNRIVNQPIVTHGTDEDYFDFKATMVVEDMNKDKVFIPDVNAIVENVQHVCGNKFKIMALPHQFMHKINPRTKSVSMVNRINGSDVPSNQFLAGTFLEQSSEDKQAALLRPESVVESDRN